MHLKQYQPSARLLRAWLARVATVLYTLTLLLTPEVSNAQADPSPTIHVPYFADSANPGQGAIFWLGKVDPNANYADVRIAYDDEALVIAMHIFDRRVWYDQAADGNGDLDKFDAVTLYLNPQADAGAALGANARRFDSAVSAWEGRPNYQRAYAWDAGVWQPTSLAFTTESGYRANPNDEGDDRGWLMRFRVPFAGLGLATTPPPGTILRVALVVHDRDAQGAAMQPAQTWPRGAIPDQPTTWGRISLGVPGYSAPVVSKPQTLSIRHGLDGAVVPDAAVGGHTTCGADYNPNFFAGWGDATYAQFAQFNIQNQWDVADWPCFSKYYVTFPLDALPAAGSVVSATLTLSMFGTAGYADSEIPRSYMQVARVAEDWDEQTISWNNAPPVMETYGWSWVDPLEDRGDFSGRPRTWDLSRAVADAQAAGEPLRLVIYSTDGDYHSGKYFWSSDANEDVRPRLDITIAAAGFQFQVIPIKPNIRSGETAEFALNIDALRTGEAATIQVEASAPPGLEVALSQTDIQAPGGQVAITLRDTVRTDDTRIYRVPVTTRSGSTTHTTELLVIVNGRELFLPLLKR
jgi:hypothetical protein